jgi:amino acid adenylation domain-containing protein
VSIASARDAAIPLSPAQSGLWLLQKLAPDSPAYHDALALRLRGRPSTGLLRRCLDELVDRHDALRLQFRLTVDGPEQSALAGYRHPLQVLPAPGAEAAMEVARAEARRPFDLEAEPPVRFTLIRSAPDDHVLLVVLHHVISDSSSMMLLLGELAALYTAHDRGEPSPLTSPAPSYLDFVRWQRDHLSPEAAARQVAYWRQQLAGAPPLLDLPTDRPRPRVMSFQGSTLGFQLPRPLGEGIARLARDHDATTFMVLLAALQLVLARSGGQDDVPVGVPMTHRVRARFRGVVGNLANTLAMRTRLDGDPTFAELLGRVRRTALGAYGHATLPFERVVEALNPPRSPAVHPLFQVLLSFFNEGRDGALDPSALDATSHRLGDLAVELLPVELGSSRLDLVVCAHDTARGLGLEIEYSADLFDAPTIERMAGHLETLLAHAVREPEVRISRLAMLTAAERGRALRDWNDTAAAYPRDLCVHELFERQVDRTPDAVALRDGTDRVTYAELEADANRLAARLRARGAGPEEVVGIQTERSRDAVVAMLAVLKAGAAYVAIDACQPWARSRAALAELGVRLLVAGEVPAADGLQVIRIAGPAEGPATRPPRTASPRNLALVIATSGSTGTPKSVGIEHRGAVSLLTWARRTFAEDELAGVLAATSACFDCTLFEVFAPLSWGGAAVLAAGALELASLPAAGEVRVVSTVPSVMAELLERGALPDSVRTVTLAGEALPPRLAARLHALPGVRRVLNLYGPSEATTYATLWTVPPGRERMTIGRPIDNVRAYVLDAALEPAPANVAGELCLAGDGLARGYLGRAAETAARFLPDPFSAEPGARLYLTGDRARWLAGGEIEYLGRLDQQVKVRGVRVEPAEVELALAAHPDVAEAVVTADREGGEARLVAWVRPHRDRAVAAGDLRAFVRERLPAAMIPAAFVAVDAMPLTTNGKVDRRALPRPESGPRPSGGTPPATRAETALASIWAAVLGVAQVRRDDDFFDLGGHSLAAMRVVARVREAMGVTLSLQTVFEATSLAALAAHIEADRGSERDEPPLRPAGGDAPRPLSFGQQRLLFLHEVAPEDASYHMPLRLRLRGELDVRALGRALDEIVRRHEVLRTSFAAGAGEPRQVVRPELGLGLEARPLRGPMEARLAESERLLAGEARRPFDLASGPLVRAALLRLDRDDHVLSVVLHHAVSDGWSMGLLFEELSLLYEAFRAGRPSPLPMPRLQYGDFATWQHRWLRSQAFGRELDHWRAELRGAPPILAVPTDHPRQALTAATAGRAPFKVRPATTSGLRGLSRRANVTLFAALLAGFQALLGRWAGQDDLLVGTPVAGRGHPELESMMGLFANTVVVRGDLRGDPSFHELLARTGRAVIAALAHHELPFEKLVEALDVRPDPRFTPLFQAMLVLNPAPRRPHLDGIEIGGAGADEPGVKFDLTLTLTDTGEFLAGRLDYRRDLFEPATARRLVRAYERLLDAAVRDPDSPPLVDPPRPGPYRPIP